MVISAEATSCVMIRADASHDAAMLGAGPTSPSPGIGTAHQSRVTENMRK